VGALLFAVSQLFSVARKAAGLEESAVFAGAKELVEVGGAANEFIGNISVFY